MKDKLATLVCAGVVVVLGGAAYLALPSLQPARRKADSKAEEAAERSRRLLDKHATALEESVDLATHIFVEDPTDQNRLTEMLEADSRPASESLKEQADRLNELARASSSRLMELDALAQRLDPESQGGAMQRVSFPTNVAGMARTLAGGLKDRAELPDASRKLLSSAAAEAQAATGVQEGEASGAENLYAVRMDGLVKYQEGLAAQREVERISRDLVGTLQDLPVVAARLEALDKRAGIVEASGIAEQIDKRRATVDEIRSQLAEHASDADQLKQKVEALRARIDEQVRIADKARTEMERLEARGLDYSSPNAVEDFTNQYDTAATQYRAALRLSEALRNGTLAHAHIDQSGNFLTGKYVSDAPAGEVEPQPGLDEYERQLRAAEAQQQATQSILSDAQDQLNRLETMKTRLEAQAARAITDAEALIQSAQSLVARYSELQTKITDAEDLAVRGFTGAERAFQKASGIWTSQVNDVPPQVDPSMAASQLQKDRNLSAYPDCQAADAEVQAALVLYGRMRRLNQAHEVFGGLSRHDVAADIDLADIMTQADAAKTKGQELAEKAVATLERASRDLRRHWTVTATIAAAYYAQALLGDDEMAAVAQANYQAVITGREDVETVRPYVERLSQLKSR